MDEPSRQTPAESLKQHGLDGPAFDVAVIAAELAGWMVAGRELDRLLRDRPVGDPTAFEPGWRLSP